MNTLRPWRLKTLTLNLTQPTIMAILNVTPDSFSDGGRFDSGRTGAFEIDLESVVDAAKKAVQDGATILDVGGESTKPGCDPIDEAEELRRVVPVVRALVERVGAPVSVDTYRPAVADETLKAGAEIVNDVAAGRYIGSQKRFADEFETGFPEETAEVAARHGAGVVLMHMRGVPKTMQAKAPEYPDGVVEEVFAFLKRRADAFVAAGVAPEQIAYDPGLGFGKTFEQNWRLVAEAERFRELGGPLLYGFSRKTFLRETARRYNERHGMTGDAALPTRDVQDFETAALSGLLAARGIEILRVHNVTQTALALELAGFSVEQGSAQ